MLITMYDISLLKMKGALRPLIVTFSLFATLVVSHQVSAADLNNAQKMVPVIMLLLDNNSIALSIGGTNSDVISNEDNPDGATAVFNGVADGLNLSFDVTDLGAGQTLNIIVNGHVVAVISSNGTYDIELSSGILNSGSQNTIEFESSPADATWTVSGITLLNSEGPFDRAEAVRFLTKATFGADQASINRLLTLGYETWIDEQFSKSPTLHYQYVEDRYADHVAGGVDSVSGCVLKTEAWLNGTVYGEDQLLQRMAWALSQIFVVSDSECEDRSVVYTYYYDVLLNGAFGNYRDLLETVTLTPAMGRFLSLRGSRADGSNTPDENYAREVMQLFSIGVHELNLDGSLKLENGQPIDTYTPEMVHDMARALSGWNLIESVSFPFNLTTQMPPWNGLWAKWHDYGEKTILNGVMIPAGDMENQTGNNIEDDLKIVLDTIAAHENVAPFLSKQLIQRFVTSNPSPQYIQRVATIFNDNGAGVKGDLSAVIKAILLDAESLNSHENLLGGKLKEPIMRPIQLWRSFEATTEIGALRLGRSKSHFGQRVLSAGTVFNFYRPDYAPIGEISDRGLVAPEFYLSGDSLLLAMVSEMYNVLSSSTLDSDQIVNGNLTASRTARGQLNLTAAKAVADNTNALMDYFNELLFGGLMSAELRASVIQYIDDEVIYVDDTNNDAALTDDERREMKVEEALALLGVSAEFSVQR